MRTNHCFLARIYHPIGVSFVLSERHVFHKKEKRKRQTGQHHINWCIEPNASLEKTQASIWLNFEELTMSHQQPKTPLQTPIVRNCTDVGPPSSIQCRCKFMHPPTARLSAGAAPIPYMHPYIRPLPAKLCAAPKFPISRNSLSTALDAAAKSVLRKVGRAAVCE